MFTSLGLCTSSLRASISEFPYWTPLGLSPAPTPSCKTRDKVCSSVHTIPVTTPGGVGFILATSVQSLLFHSHPLEKSQIIWWAMVITVVKIFCYYLHRTRHETLITVWECPIIPYITLFLPSTPTDHPRGTQGYTYITPPTSAPKKINIMCNQEERNSMEHENVSWLVTWDASAVLTVRSPVETGLK